MANDKHDGGRFDRAAILGAIARRLVRGSSQPAHTGADDAGWRNFLELVASLQRREEINLLAAATAQKGGVRYYAVEMLLGTILPELDLTAEALFAASGLLAERSRGTGFPYLLTTLISGWAERFPDRVDAAPAAILAGALAPELLVPILNTGMKLESDRYGTS